LGVNNTRVFLPLARPFIVDQRGRRILKVTF
jgi:hypothetical protein